MGEIFGQPTPTRDHGKLKKPTEPATPGDTTGTANAIGDLSSLFANLSAPTTETQRQVTDIENQMQEIRGRLDEIHSLEVPQSRISRKYDKVLGPGGGAKFIEWRVKQKFSAGLLDDFVRLQQERRLLLEPNQAQVKLFNEQLDLYMKQVEASEANAVMDGIEKYMAEGGLAGWGLDPGNVLAYRESGDPQFLKNAFRSPQDMQNSEHYNRLATLGSKMEPEALEALRDAFSPEDFAFAYAASTSKITKEMREKGIRFISQGGKEFKDIEEVREMISPAKTSERFKEFVAIMGETPFRRKTEGGMAIFGPTVVEGMEGAGPEHIKNNPEEWLLAGERVLRRLGTLNDIPIHEVLGDQLAREEPELLSRLSGKTSRADVLRRELEEVEAEATDILREMQEGAGTTDEGTDG